MGSAKMGTKGRAVIHEHLQKVLAELIANDLRKDFQRPPKNGGPAATGSSCSVHRLDIHALVLNWWLESRNPPPPDEIDDVFRALVLPTLAATGE